MIPTETRLEFPPRDRIPRVEVAVMLDRMNQHYFLDSQSVESTRIVDLLEYLLRRGVTS